MAIFDIFRSDETIAANKAKNELDQSQSQIISQDNESLIDAQQDAKGNYTLAQGHSDRVGGYKNGETLFYPQELFTTSQPHGVHFYINARQTSVAAEDEATHGDLARLQEVNAQYNKDYTAENRSKAEQYENAAALSGALAAAIGTGATIAGGGILKDASSLGKVLVTGVSAAVGAVAGKMIANNTSTMRLLKSIQLHVPQSVMSAYAANWDEAQLGVAGILGSGRADLSDIKELPEFLGRGAISAAANIPKGLGANADFAATLEATSKKVANPYKEQLFKSMGFRKFSFSYVFAPRNLGEANMVMEIIDTFKYHMHPETSPGDMFLIYPSEFSIEFETLDQNGKVIRNPYLPRVSSCALSSVKATYGPDGFFNTFQETDGIPTEMGLELQFTELETLTAVRIAQGH
jgi:hypothetical protein